MKYTVEYDEETRYYEVVAWTDNEGRICYKSEIKEDAEIIYSALVLEATITPMDEPEPDDE